MISLQAIGCYCYWDVHLMKLSEHVHSRVYTECTVAWAASSSPVGERAGAGRGWRMDGDGWLAEDRGGSGGRVCGPDLVLAVMKEKQTDVTVTNEPSPLPQLPVLCLSNSQSPPPPSHHFPHVHPLLSPTVPNFFQSYFVFSPWCHFISLPPTLISASRYGRFLCMKTSRCIQFGLIWSITRLILTV